MDIYVGLIKGRHPLPCQEYIFDNAIENVHDYNGISTHIYAYLLNKVQHGLTINEVLCDDISRSKGDHCLYVYVTGLTPVTVELVKACAYLGINLTLLNYDRDTNSYIKQRVF